MTGAATTIEELAARLARLARGGVEHHPLDQSLKFDLGEDGTITPAGNRADLSDLPADCTIRRTLPNAVKRVQLLK